MQLDGAEGRPAGRLALSLFHILHNQAQQLPRPNPAHTPHLHLTPIPSPTKPASAFPPYFLILHEVAVIHLS